MVFEYITSNLALFNELQVIDLTRVSQELAYLASDADLVILEGMVSFLLHYVHVGISYCNINEIETNNIFLLTGPRNRNKFVCSI